MLQSLSPNNGQLPSLPRPHELVGSTADGSGPSVTRKRRIAPAVVSGYAGPRSYPDPRNMPQSPPSRSRILRTRRSPAANREDDPRVFVASSPNPWSSAASPSTNAATVVRSNVNQPLKKSASIDSPGHPLLNKRGVAHRTAVPDAEPAIGWVTSPSTVTIND
jgi:hypothetical protein